MQFPLWSAIIGLLLVMMALGQTVLARLPLSTSMLYLGAGVLVSPAVFGLASFTAVSHAVLLEHMAEVIVLLSLFTSGLKMSVGLGDGRWLLPVRLAITSMIVTVALVAAIAMWLLHLPLGAAVLLGAILAPTDPVLASEVQIAAPGDRDRLRFALTGEAGLNDGSAFPFVMLGLGLLGLHELGDHGSRWFGVDVLWGSIAGLAIGALLGSAVGKLVTYLRQMHQEAVGLDNFLALGLIAIAYGAAVLVQGYGFLAVFAAGVALRRFEQRETSRAAARAAEAPPAAPTAPAATAEADIREQKAPDGREGELPAALAALDPEATKRVATDPQHAPAFLAHAMLSFNEQLERIGEVAGVMVIGMVLWAVQWHRVQWWFIVLLLLLVRPVSVAIGLAGSATSGSQRALIGWFGIRGIGSLYYLMYATNRGLDPDLAQTLIALSLSAVVVSITAHGISVTPLMNLYERNKARRKRVRVAEE